MLKWIKSHKFISIALILVLLIIGISAGSHPDKKSNTANGGSTIGVTSANQNLHINGTPTQTPRQPKTLLDISGNGSNQTAAFTTDSRWQVTYTYDCSNAGGSGNFQTVVENTDGSFNTDAGANELGASGGNTEHYYDAGEHYLKINSECNWHVTVID